MNRSEKSEQSRIALVDFHAVGHHPTYLRFFAESIGEALCAVSAPGSPELESLPKTVFRLGTFSPKWSRCWRFRGRFSLEAVERFLFLRRELRRLEKKEGKKIDRVFFACLYDDEFGGSIVWRRFFRWPWSALYLHPASDAAGEPSLRGWMKTERLKGLCVFDVAVADQIKSFLPHKQISVLPDIPNTESRQGALSQRINELAKGRRIVVLSGYLGRNKGVLEYVRAANRLKESDLFFVLIGHINFSDFTESEQVEISRWGQETENVFFFPSRIESEELLNGVLEIAHVMCAVYRNWPFSSNAISKAVHFQNRILVAKGYFMERRVMDLGIGASVDEGDVDGIAKQLVLLSGEEIDSQQYERAGETLSMLEFSKAVKSLLEE